MLRMSCLCLGLLMLLWPGTVEAQVFLGMGLRLDRDHVVDATTIDGPTFDLTLGCQVWDGRRLGVAAELTLTPVPVADADIVSGPFAKLSVLAHLRALSGAGPFARMGLLEGSVERQERSEIRGRTYGLGYEWRGYGALAYRMEVTQARLMPSDGARALCRERVGFEAIYRF